MSKDPIQIADIKNQIIYTFGEQTIEVDGVIVDEVPEDFPFARVKLDEGEKNLLDETNNAAQSGLIGSKAKCDS